jgi:DNA-binding PadR family transcriptional regulator
MKHGDIRPRIISSVFALRRFTTPALCEHSGLIRSQAYPILKDLEEIGFIHSEPLQDPKRKAQRPLNIYRLTDEVSTKKMVLDEIEPIVRAAENAAKEVEPESLSRARTALNEISSQLAALERNADDRFSSHWNSLEVSNVRQKLQSLSSDLEQSLVEEGVAGDEVPPAIDAEIKRFEAAKAQLTEVELRVDLIQRKLDAEKETSHALREVAAYSLAVAGEPALDSLVSSTFASCYPVDQQPRWVAELAKKAKRYLDQSRGTDISVQLERGLLEVEYKHTKNPEFKSILSAIEADLMFAFREVARTGSTSNKSVLFWRLAQLAIRYAGDADTTLLATKLMESNVDANSSIASYNSLNLCLLAGNTEQAFSKWRDLDKEYDERPSRSLTQPLYPGLLLATMPAAVLNQDVLDKFESVLGVTCSWSIISPVRLPAVAANPFVVEPTLCNPLEISERIRISDSLRIHAPDLYVYGPIENSVRRPGVPQVALASGLATLGVPRIDAWEFASGLGHEKVLVVVNSSRAVQEQTLQRWGAFVRVLFAAAHRHSPDPTLVSAGYKPTNVFAKEGNPVLYDLGSEGKVREAFTATAALAVCNNE